MFIPIGDQPNPRGFTPWVNYALIAANTAVFLLVTLPLMWRGADANDPMTQAYLRALIDANPDVDPTSLAYQVLKSTSAYDIFLLSWGYRPADPSVLALFTSMFLHGGWLHLVGNMLFLWIYGDNVEHRLGRIGYAVAYLATGVAAALGYGAFVSGPASGVPMVGASGAISGVMGFYFLWFPRNKVRLLVLLFPFFFFVWTVGARFVLGFYLIVDNLMPFLLKSTGQSGGGGVAHGAHIGGFVAGLAAAFVIDRWLAFLCKRQARECGEVSADDLRQLGSTSSAAAMVLEAKAMGDNAHAVRLYLELPRLERLDVPVSTVIEMGDWLAKSRQPDAALAIYRQALDDHPRGPGLDRIFLGIGLVLLHLQGKPTAAYQFLLDALDADPSSEVERQAREALTIIENMQKYQVRSRRKW